MNQVCDFDICTGCAACVARCPQHCITMQIKNGLGHLYPVVDQNFCIDCGACRKVCPALHEVKKEYPKKAYAGWDKNKEEYESSTSAVLLLLFHAILLEKVV